MVLTDCVQNGPPQINTHSSHVHMEHSLEQIMLEHKISLNKYMKIEISRMFSHYNNIKV